MSVLAQLVHDRESWGKCHRQQVGRSRTHWAVVEFVGFVAVVAAFLVYHQVIIETAKQLLSQF